MVSKGVANEPVARAARLATKAARFPTERAVRGIRGLVRDELKALCLHQLRLWRRTHSITDAAAHYHVPLLASPWNLSTDHPRFERRSAPRRGR